MTHLALLVAAILLTLNSASAAVISLDASFAASNSGPVNPVTGSFSVTFDGAVSFTDRTEVIKFSALNIKLDSEIGASYFAEHDVVLVGGMRDGVVSVAQNSFDFWLVIKDVSDDPKFGDPFGTSPLVYTQGGMFHFAHDVVGVIEQVPEPATLALLGVGLAGLGLSRRRKAN